MQTISKMSTHTTVLLDIDGTLLMTHGAGTKALETAIRVVFQVDSPNMNIQFGGRTDGDLIGQLLTQNAIPNEAEHRRRLREAYLNRFPDEMTAVGGIALPGAAEFLKWGHRETEIRLVAMTGNCVASAHEKLKYFGFDAFVEKIFGGDDDQCRVDLAKRTVGSLKEQHAEVSHPSHRLVVIGDTPNDVICAKSIEAIAVGVTGGGFTKDDLLSAGADYVADSLEEPHVKSIVTNQ